MPRRGSAVRCAMLLTAVAGCDLVVGIGTPPPGPQLLQVDGRGITRDLEGVPALVALDAALVRDAEITDLATQLRFHDEATDADLPFEVDAWRPEGESLVWVRLPRVRAGEVMRDITLFTGPSAGGEARPGEVWTGYELVAHGPGRGNPASVRYQPALELNDTPPAPMDGALADAFAFTGDERLPFADSQELFGGWGTFSLELWLYGDYDDAALPAEQHILDQGGALALGRFLRGYDPNPDIPLTLQLDTKYALASGATEGGDVYQQGFVFPRSWTYLTWTFDGRNQWLYIDGAFHDLAPLPEPGMMQPTSQRLVLGPGQSGFRGAIDELRVSRSYRDPDWMAIQAQSMSRRLITLLPR